MMMHYASEGQQALANRVEIRGAIEAFFTSASHQECFFFLAACFL
jgi:hypothetical protein